MSVAEPADRSPYLGYRYPPEIIAHGVVLDILVKSGATNQQPSADTD
jgi:hypothetical protein